MQACLKPQTQRLMDVLLLTWKWSINCEDPVKKLKLRYLQQQSYDARDNSQCTMMSCYNMLEHLYGE